MRCPSSASPNPPPRFHPWLPSAPTSTWFRPANGPVALPGSRPYRRSRTRLGSTSGMLSPSGPGVCVRSPMALCTLYGLFHLGSWFFFRGSFQLIDWFDVVVDNCGNHILVLCDLPFPLYIFLICSVLVACFGDSLGLCIWLEFQIWLLLVLKSPCSRRWAPAYTRECVCLTFCYSCDASSFRLSCLERSSYMVLSFMKILYAAN